MRLLRGLSTRLTGWLLVLAPLPTLASCAVADTRLDDGFFSGDSGDGGGSDVHFDGGKDTNGSSTDTSTSGIDTRSGGTDTGTSGSDTKPGTDTGSSGDTSTGTDSGPTCTAADVTMCASSTAMGSVSGDTGSDVKTTTGSNGQWLKIDVTEDDSSIFSSKDLKVKITLDSPTGSNFDLYVYEGKEKGDGGGIECTLVAGSSTLSSSPDVVSLGWADNHPVGGHDDSRTLSIEVRPAGGPCDPTATWTVTVSGNK